MNVPMDVNVPMNVPMDVNVPVDDDVDELHDYDVPASDNVPMDDNVPMNNFSSRCLSTLRRVVGNESAEYRSMVQKSFVEACVKSDRDILAVVPTGFGKSLSFLVPASLDGSVSIVVCPLRALLINMLDRCAKAQVSAVEWRPNLASCGTHQIVFVSLDNAGSRQFQQFLLRNKSQFKRVIVDEAHLLLTWTEFRSVVHNVALIRTVSKSLVLLTGSLPPHMQSKLISKVHAVDPVIFRESCDRPDLEYRVSIDLNVGLMRQTLVRQCTDFLDNGTPCAKAVVFCYRCVDVDPVIALLKAELNVLALKVTGKCSSEEKAASLAQWRAHGGFMVATSALSYGVDIEGIESVIHYGAAHSMISYAQECGRAARGSSETGQCSVVTCLPFLKSLIHNSPNASCVEWIRWVAENKCRRYGLTKALDGNGVQCSRLKCDVCHGLKTCNVGRGRAVLRLIESEIETRRKLAEQVATVERISGSLRALGSSVCVPHLVLQNKVVEHPLNECELIRKSRRCFQCLSSKCHDRSKCPVRRAKKTCNDLCGSCFLPASDVAMFHRNNAFGSGCLYKDKVLPLAMLLREQRSPLLGEMGQKSSDEYISWLFQYPITGMTNMGLIFDRWYSSRYG